MIHMIETLLLRVSLRALRSIVVGIILISTIHIITSTIIGTVSVLSKKTPSELSNPPRPLASGRVDHHKAFRTP